MVCGPLGSRLLWLTTGTGILVAVLFIFLLAIIGIISILAILIIWSLLVAASLGRILLGCCRLLLLLVTFSLLLWCGLVRSDPEGGGRRARDVLRWRDRARTVKVIIIHFFLLVGILFAHDNLLRTALHFLIISLFLLFFPELVRIVVQDLVCFMRKVQRLGVIDKQKSACGLEYR